MQLSLVGRGLESKVLMVKKVHYGRTPDTVQTESSMEAAHCLKKKSCMFHMKLGLKHPQCVGFNMFVSIVSSVSMGSNLAAVT